MFKTQSPKTGRFMIRSSVICFGLILIVTLLVMIGNRFIELRTKELVGKLEKKFGISVEVSRHQLSTGKIEFQGINIGEEALAMVGAIRAKVNFNPFTGPIGFANRIEIDGLRLKANVQQLPKLRKLLQNKTSNKASTTTGADESLSFDIRNASVQLVAPNGKNLVLIQSVNARSIAAGNLSFSLGDIYLLERDLSHLNAYGTLNRNQSGSLILEMRSPHFGEESFLTANLSQIDHEMDLNWYIEKIPDLLLPHIKNHKAVDQNLQVKGRTLVKLDGAKDSLHFKTFVHTRNVGFHHPLLAQSKVGPVNVSFKAIGHFNYSNRSLRIHDGMIASRKDAETEILKIAYQAESIHTINGQLTTLFLDLNKLSCNALLQNIPQGLAGKLQNFAVKGHINSSLEFSIQNLDAETIDFRAHHTDIGCQLTRVPQTYSLKTLRHSRFLAGRTNGGLTLAPLGHKTSNPLVPYELLPAALKVALVAAEDTGFWKHNGFEFNSLVSAMKMNLASGEVAMGGSTITMQTAKNLFLTRERTIARKIEEMFFTWYLEKYLTKKRILEIYANIIEYGPGLYGAGNAAKTIFGKDLPIINLKESLFLTTLLPSPVKRFANVCNNSVSEGFNKLMWDRFYRVKGLLKNSPDELHRMMREPLAFNQIVRQDLSRCGSYANNLDIAVSRPVLARKTF